MTLYDSFSSLDYFFPILIKMSELVANSCALTDPFDDTENVEFQFHELK